MHSQLLALVDQSLLRRRDPFFFFYSLFDTGDLKKNPLMNDRPSTQCRRAG